MIKCIQCNQELQKTVDNDITSYDCETCQRSITFTGDIELVTNEDDAV